MKKLINLSMLYAIAAIACGVFYREFTKILGYTGQTTLAFTHLHLFTLGTLLFLVLALFCVQSDLLHLRQFKIFMILYNIGLPFMVIMLFVRGIPQALNTTLTATASAAVSGIAGISHILLTVAIVMMFIAIKKARYHCEK